MKPIFTIFILMVGWVTFHPANAQNINEIVPAVKEGMYSSFADFKVSPPVFNREAVTLADENGRWHLSKDNILLKVEKDELGFEHCRYQQTFPHTKIPIEYAIYILHVKNGFVQMGNGRWIKDFPAGISTRATITEDVALQSALKFIGARQYKWEIAGEERLLKEEEDNSNATYFPKGELVFYSGEEDVNPSKLRLVYKFNIYAHYPLSRQVVFVDANTARVIGKEDLIHACGSTTPIENSEIPGKNKSIKDLPATTFEPAVGTANTAYSGAQSITTLKYNVDGGGYDYMLKDVTRGKGIKTHNMKKAGNNYYLGITMIDDDNVWQNTGDTKYATDAQWAAQKWYDYFKLKLKRNSIDNAGFALKNYVHADLTKLGYFDNSNAFWDGSRLTFGDGSNGKTAYTTVDISAHEITHGFTGKTSNLIYYGESGALNEAISDIFGTVIEFYAKPSKANWLFGEETGYASRNLSEPNESNLIKQPDTYKGEYWETGTYDYGGVHINSGILNYWFYLLSEGGSGTNDYGIDYSVQGLGMDKAAAIAYRMNAYYLVPTSKFVDAWIASVQAAGDLYGYGKFEAAETYKAWIAVGIGGSIIPCSDIYEPNDGRHEAANIKSTHFNKDLLGRITYKDEDWYTFSTTATTPKIRIVLKNLPGYYLMNLYRQKDNALLASSEKLGTDQVINYNGNSAEDYYLKIYGGALSYDLKNCYTFRIITNIPNFSMDQPNGLITLNNVKDGPSAARMSDQKSNMLNETANLIVYPNPIVNNTLNLQFTDDAHQSKEIVIVDIRGKIVFSKKITVNKGVNNVQIKLPSMAKGMYIVKLDKMISKINIL